MRDQRETYENSVYDRDLSQDRRAAESRYRDEYDSGYRNEDRYDSHYDEGEDPVAFVNVIDMDYWAVADIEPTTEKGFAS